MYYQGIEPTVLINTNVFNYYVIVNFLNELNLNVTPKRMPNDMISKYWDQPPGALVMNVEDAKIIVDFDRLKNIFSYGDISLLGISSSESNMLLKRFLGLGGEAVIYQNNNIILAKGAIAQELDHIIELRGSVLQIKDILLCYAVAHCLNSKASNLVDKKSLETIKA